MPLDALEIDFLGALASDTHGVWEIFGYARLHYPGLSDAEIFELGSEYLNRWIENGWLKVAAKPLHPTRIGQLGGILKFAREHGTLATFYIENSPSVDITDVGLSAYKKQPPA